MKPSIQSFQRERDDDKDIEEDEYESSEFDELSVSSDGTKTLLKKHVLPAQPSKLDVFLRYLSDIRKITPFIDFDQYFKKGL